jgi:hypothetical protein
MKTFTKSVVGVAALAVLAALVLPLRLISERSYAGGEQRIEIGKVWAEVDPTDRPMPVRFWFDGSLGESPYRMRVFLLPDSAQSKEVVMMSGRVRDGQSGAELALASQKAYGPVPDRDGRLIFISGYLELALEAKEVPVEVMIDTGGHSYAVHLVLRSTQKKRLVHAGVEAAMGI